MDIFRGMPYGIKEIITNRMLATTAISPAGALIPLLDTAAITAIWSNMLYEIGKYHKVSFTVEECTKIITACGSSVMGYLCGSKFLNWLLNLIPGIGTLGAMAGNVVFNGYYTFAIGSAFHRMLEDYDINKATVKEIAKILINLFVPRPSKDDLVCIYQIMKEHLS